jgi:hypothetical protein
MEIRLRISIVDEVALMEILMFIIVLAVAFVIGVFGFCQIIGSFQNIHIRGIGITAFTVILWAVILIAEFFVAKSFFADQMIAYYIGTVVSFIMSLQAGKIQ